MVLVNDMKTIKVLLTVILSCLIAFSCTHEKRAGNDELTEELRDMLKNTEYMTVKFDGTHMGYVVTAEIHPDKDNKEVGMAKFSFTSKAGKIVIVTPYYWDWTKEVTVAPSPIGSPGWATYAVPHRDNAVQDGKSEIEIIQPFLFKDVDFDGEREILFSHFGYNRIYYSAYKIVSSTEALYMSEFPLIVYGLDDSTTHFDYEHQRILIHEQLGCCETLNEEYVRRRRVKDLKNGLSRTSNSRSDAIFASHY